MILNELIFLPFLHFSFIHSSGGNRDEGGVKWRSGENVIGRGRIIR